MSTYKIYGPLDPDDHFHSNYSVDSITTASTLWKGVAEEAVSHVRQPGLYLLLNGDIIFSFFRVEEDKAPLRLVK